MYCAHVPENPISEKKALIKGSYQGYKYSFLFLFLAVPDETDEVCRKIWDPESSGYSKSRIPRGNQSVYYDAESNTCKNFSTLGCLGNANNFGSMKSCEDKCIRE